MIPLYNMINHELESHQVTWEPCMETLVVDPDGDVAPHPPQAIMRTGALK
jgi:hypothetical protein